MKKINYKKLKISNLLKVLSVLIIAICLGTLFSFKKFQAAQIEAKSKRNFTIQPQRGASNSIGQRPMYKANKKISPEGAQAKNYVTIIIKSLC